ARRPLMCAVAAAPGPAGVRVWAIMSRARAQGRGGRRRRVLVLAILGHSLTRVWRNCMNQRYELRRRLALAIALVISFLLPPVAQATPLTYVLLPGSTITPTSGSTPTGPTEPLTGTFQLVGPDLGNGFDAVALSFASPSFSITLNLTALNDLETFVSPI